MFKGLSTFAVEMCELRNILTMSDQNSLILGDELGFTQNKYKFLITLRNAFL